MAKPSYRIAIAQINPAVGSLRGNFKKIIEYIEYAEQKNSDLVIFPELALCGYPPEDLLFKEYFIKDNIRMLDSIKERVRGITAVVGFVDVDKNKRIYNAAAVIHNGKIKGVYRKKMLPNYGVFDEKRYFTPGNKDLLFKKGDLIFGVTICEDIWEENGPYNVFVKSGANLIINISASPYYTGKLKVRKDMLAARAKETGSFVCYANLVGGQDELVFDGASFMFDNHGKVIASGKQFEEDLIIKDIDISNTLRRKKKTPYQGDISTILIDAAPAAAKRTAIPRHVCNPMGRLEEIYRALVLGTRDYFRKNGFKKAVIGLSGGIDSSLTAVIACDALGKENVTGVTMPSRYSSKETQRDAKEFANNLRIGFLNIPIDAIFDVYLIALGNFFSGLPRDIAEENLQARIRGNILMALSNKFGWLVLTTGNKSETAVGYCTLYGDMAGGFAVIKDVPKTLIYQLAEFINKKEKAWIIQKTILEREPSAELKFNQKDKDALPPYDILDAILKEYIEEEKGLKDIVFKKYDPNTVKKVIEAVDRNEYKRRQSPPGVKITPKSFGKDRRLPITNGYKGYEYYA